MTTKTAQTIPMRTRAFSAVPSSVNVEARTFEAVISDETPCIDCIYDSGTGSWMEAEVILPLDAMDLSRAEGMPLVDGHNYAGIGNTIGLVENIRRDGDAWVATCRLTNERAALIIDIAEGFHRQTSIGYNAPAYEIERREGQLPLARAKSYQLLEVSLVNIGANPNTMTRSHELSFPAPTLHFRSAAPTIRQENSMTLEELVAEAEAALKAVADATDEGAAEEVVARAANLREFAAASDEEPKTEGEDAARAEGDEDEAVTADEDKENAAIEASAREFGLDKFVRGLRTAHTKPKDIRKAFRSEMLRRGATGTEANDIEPKRGTQQPTVIDTTDIYQRANSRFHGKRA